MSKTKRFIDQVAEKLSEETGKDIEWCLEFIPEHGCTEFWSDYLYREDGVNFERRDKGTRRIN